MVHCMKTAELVQNMQELSVVQPQHILNQSGQDPDTQELSVVQSKSVIEQGRQEQDTQEMAALNRRYSIEQRIKERHVLDSIKQRRSVGQLTQEQPSREQIECMLEAATYAPNHHTTEPWRFFVVTGGAREELGAMMAASLRMSLQDTSPEKKQLLVRKERGKTLRAPIIITVAVPGNRDAEGLFIENIEAASAAVQNMLLASEAMGLATIWRTGDAAYDPLIKRWFGLTPEDHIVGFIYVGYPKVSRPMRTPTPFSERTTWLS
jgi:nitroreductase